MEISKHTHISKHFKKLSSAFEEIKTVIAWKIVKMVFWRVRRSCSVAHGNSRWEPQTVAIQGVGCLKTSPSLFTISRIEQHWARPKKKEAMIKCPFSNVHTVHTNARGKAICCVTWKRKDVSTAKNHVYESARVNFVAPKFKVEV